MEQLPKRTQTTFGGAPRKTASSSKSESFVTIIRHNHSTGRACESPNTLVGRLGELDVAHMVDVEEVGERDRETRSQILIEAQLDHDARSERCSRSAA